MTFWQIQDLFEAWTRREERTEKRLNVYAGTIAASVLNIRMRGKGDDKWFTWRDIFSDPESPSENSAKRGNARGREIAARLFGRLADVAAAMKQKKQTEHS